MKERVNPFKLADGVGYSVPELNDNLVDLYRVNSWIKIILIT